LKGKKKERKEKKKDAWMPALVVPWGEIPPDPPFNPPANKHPHPPPLGRKGKKEKKKKPDACLERKKRKKSLTPAFVNRIRH